jgi:hypothetical protein
LILHCGGPNITLSFSQNKVKAVLTLNSTTIFYCHKNFCHLWLSHKPFTVKSKGSWLWPVTTTRTIISDIVHHPEYFQTTMFWKLILFLPSGVWGERFLVHWAHYGELVQIIGSIYQSINQTINSVIVISSL